MSENDSTNVQKLTVRRPCIKCRQEYEVEVSVDGWIRWREGELIQFALPELSKAERELMISGVCGGCFDAMFGSEDDEEGDDDVALPDLHGTDDRGSDGEWGEDHLLGVSGEGVPPTPQAVPRCDECDGTGWIPIDNYWSVRAAGTDREACGKCRGTGLPFDELIDEDAADAELPEARR